MTKGNTVCMFLKLMKINAIVLTNYVVGYKDDILKGFL